MELKDSEFREFATFVYSTCGICLHDGKKEMVKARLGRIMRTKGFSRFDDYFQSVRADSTGDEVIALINAISTNLTYFYREPRHFDFMTDTIIPELNRKRTSRSRLRLWSAGCSTGEEAYSLAMLFLEHLTPPIGDLKILATDISTRVLQHSMRGVYSEDRISSIPPSFLRKYFRKGTNEFEGQYVVTDPVRNLIHFARLNLMEPFPMKGPFAVVMCRNVMIYFDQLTREHLVAKFHSLIGPGGYFFVGHSESLTGIKHPFKYVGPSVYRK